MVLHLVPLTALFTSTRLAAFGRKSWLILVLGPPIYWLGLMVALSIGVGAGLLEP